MIAAAAIGLLALGLLAAVATLLVLLARDLWRALFRESERARQRRLRAAARLTPAEAVALAATAIAEPFFRDALAATLDEHDGALLWRVSSMTIDMGVATTVNDATGAVGEVQRWSGWPQR